MILSYAGTRYQWYFFNMMFVFFQTNGRTWNTRKNIITCFDIFKRYRCLLWKGSLKRFNLDTPENAVVTLVTASLLGKKLNAINFM